jgi:FixJ family two-component response regulator
VTEDQATVFVVDDDLSVRRGVARLLRSDGYRVETFASAREFLERADLRGSGCLVVDVRMPGENGLDLQRALAAAGHATPVIFITGHGDVSLAARAMTAGAVEFLTKPFDDSVLLDAVRQALTRAHRASATDSD